MAFSSAIGSETFSSLLSSMDFNKSSSVIVSLGSSPKAFLTSSITALVTAVSVRGLISFVAAISSEESASFSSNPSTWLSSGSPNSITCKRICFTRPRSSPIYSIGLWSVKNSTPSSLACFTSSKRAGISSSLRR